MPIKVDFRQTTDQQCEGWHKKDHGHQSCKRKLKKNLKARIPTATRCWRCHRKHYGHIPMAHGIKVAA